MSVYQKVCGDIVEPWKAILKKWHYLLNLLHVLKMYGGSKYGFPGASTVKKTWNVEPGSKNRYTYYAFLTVWMTRPHSTVEKCTTEMACQTRHLQAFEKLKTGVSQRSAVKGLWAQRNPKCTFRNGCFGSGGKIQVYAAHTAQSFLVDAGKGRIGAQAGEACGSSSSPGCRAGWWRAAGGWWTAWKSGKS